MSINDFQVVETPDNYEQKCCCALVLDVSSSMVGAPIQELNDGLQELYKDILDDAVAAKRLEIAIVEFSSTVETLIGPSLVSNFSMPILTSKGTTKLVDGVMEGISIVRKRKQWYKSSGQSYYRPWVILITDGAPDNDQDKEALANEINRGMNLNEFYFLAIGVQNADMQMLKSISGPKMPPLKLQGLKFAEFFRWLSASLSAVAHSTEGKTSFGDATAWMQSISV